MADPVRRSPLGTAVTGEWASYTAMPTFGSVHGGPLNELYLRAVATFIMMGDWRQVPSHIPPPNIPDDRELALSRMPDAASLGGGKPLRQGTVH